MSEVKILHQGPGYTIAETSEAVTIVPYLGSAQRENGSQNHGFMDLRGRPELVDKIPEAQKSTGLSTFLRTLADPSSKLMSSGCECHAFEKFDNPQSPRWVAGCYINVMFQDAIRNKNKNSMRDIAAYSLNGVGPPPEGIHIGFELLIEPLKGFFGVDGCYCVMIKTLGFGATKDQAWTSMNYALEALAASISRDRNSCAEPKL